MVLCAGRVAPGAGAARRSCGGARVLPVQVGLVGDSNGGVGLEQRHAPAPAEQLCRYRTGVRGRAAAQLDHEARGVLFGDLPKQRANVRAPLAVLTEQIWTRKAPVVLPLL